MYGAESRLLEYLRKQGILKIDSIQGGNVYGSLEGQLHENDKAVEITLMKISEWMETEQPMMSGRTGYDDMSDDHLLSPDGEYSTELGEVPAAEKKGSINQHNLFAPYLYEIYIRMKQWKPLFIENSKIPVWLSYLAPIDIGAITLGPIVISRGEMSEDTRRHETIHFQQFLELAFVGFVILYYGFWLWNLIRGGDGESAYYNIPFEKEA